MRVDFCIRPVWSVEYCKIPRTRQLSFDSGAGSHSDFVIDGCSWAGVRIGQCAAVASRQVPPIVSDSTAYDLDRASSRSCWIRGWIGSVMPDQRLAGGLRGTM